MLKGREVMRGPQLALLGAALALVAGCVPPPPIGAPAPEPAPSQQPAPPTAKPSPEQINDAFEQLNTAFAKAYERVLTERGTRSFRVPPAVAYDALQAALTRLGMIVENRDPVTGTLTVAAPAPKPLTLTEWRQVVQADLPMMASILCPRLGAYCRGIKFEPDDYVIVINATVLPMRNAGAEVALTTRLREIVPRPGVPRRDYPPPTGVRMALDKIWAQFDQALAARQPGR
jgi:hypothetical protein